MESATLQPVSLINPDNRAQPMRHLCLALLLILLVAGAGSATATAEENKPPGSSLTALTPGQLSQLVPPGVSLGPQRLEDPRLSLAAGWQNRGVCVLDGHSSADARI